LYRSAVYTTIPVLENNDDGVDVEVALMAKVGEACLPLPLGEFTYRHVGREEELLARPRLHRNGYQRHMHMQFTIVCVFHR
jgi:hypothetical protein